MIISPFGVVETSKMGTWPYETDRFVRITLAASLLFFCTPLISSGEDKQSEEAAAESPVDTVDFSITETSVRTIRLFDNASKVLHFSRPIVRTAVGDPSILDVVAINQHEVMIVASGIGGTSLVVWEAGGTNHVFQIFVEQDPHALEDVIKATYPDTSVTVHPLGDTVALRGYVKSIEQRTRLMELAEGYVQGPVNMLSIQEPKQILVDVYFVELDLTDSDDYGQSYSYFRKNLILNTLAGNVKGQAFQDTAFALADTDITAKPLGQNSSAQFTNAFSDLNHLVSQQVEWLETKGFLRVIAKPKLLARDGEEADFLVGGEFPFATVQDGATNVQWREFGHQLTFTPEILEGDRIRLTVVSTVSELNFNSTLVLSGATVPSMIENSARTVVELKDHQTLVIGGFISTRVNNTTTKVPVFGDLPFVGRMFQSDDQEERKHELMFIITPHVIRPLDLEDADKAGEYFEAGDIDRVLHIDEVPDDTFQRDVMLGALNNYDQNRLLADAGSEELETYTLPLARQEVSEAESPSKDSSFPPRRPRGAVGQSGRPPLVQTARKRESKTLDPRLRGDDTSVAESYKAASDATPTPQTAETGETKQETSAVEDLYLSIVSPPVVAEPAPYTAPSVSGASFEMPSVSSQPPVATEAPVVFDADYETTSINSGTVFAPRREEEQASETSPGERFMPQAEFASVSIDSYYDIGVRNFRMLELQKGPTDWASLYREQEQVDPLLDKMLPKRGVST